jgi:hypothetical protein
LVKQGSDGVLTFTLVQSDNAPPIRGYNSWQVKITRKDGTSMTGEVIPDVKMPRHMHPAGLQPDVTYDSALGLYKATPVHFFMAGYWSAQFAAYEGSADSGTPLDRGTFYFCVD